MMRGAFRPHPEMQRLINAILLLDSSSKVASSSDAAENTTAPLRHLQE